MKERRSHTKSRAGCRQCKARRVKCDEKVPTCSACRKRQVHCVYETPQTKHSPHADDGTPSTGSPAGPREHDTHRHAGVDIRRHRAELELIYHWCTNTYATVSFDGQQRIGTQHDITQTALKHDFLLDAVFALTSLHLASLRPKEAQILVDDALRYQTSAISASRRSLENLNASECRAQFQCSALLGICALALHTTDSTSVTRQGPTDALISLAQLWRGTGSIMAVSYKLLGSGAYEQMFLPLPLAEVVETAEPDLEANACISRLESLAKAKETNSAIFLEAVAGLREAFTSSGVNDGTYVYQVLKWAPTTPLEFIDQLCQREPLACAMTMVYAVSFQLVEDHWWMRGFSRRLVDELAVIVAHAMPDYMDVIEWAKAKTTVRRLEPAPIPLKS